MQLQQATMFISSMQTPAPNAQDTLIHQPALLSALQSASFRHKQKISGRKRKARNHPLFFQDNTS
jgi:hypothetical protein